MGLDYATCMKSWLVCGLMLLGMAAHAQELADKALPRVPVDENGMPLSLSAAERRALVNEMKAGAMMSEPMVCADLSATPVALANGDFQYPVKPCKKIDVSTAPDPASLPQEQPRSVQSVRANAPVQAGGGSPVQPQAVMNDGGQAGAAATGNLNMLQMKRYGELDAMQGRPINMNYANNLGYIQGYTEGQARRMRGPQGGFGGFNR